MNGWHIIVAKGMKITPINHFQIYTGRVLVQVVPMTSTHLALMYRQRGLLEDEPFGPPKPGNETVLLDGDGPAADDVVAAEHVGLAVGRAADARVVRCVGRGGGGRGADGEGGGVAGVGEDVLYLVAASDGCRRSRA